MELLNLSGFIFLYWLYASLLLSNKLMFRAGYGDEAHWKWGKFEQTWHHIVGPLSEDTPGVSWQTSEQRIILQQTGSLVLRVNRVTVILVVVTVAVLVVLVIEY